MASENESIESIVAEMRHPKPGTLADVCPWWADGGDCVKCPLGGGGKMCIFDKFADRIDAAWKRERELLRSCARWISTHDIYGNMAQELLAECKKVLGDDGKFLMPKGDMV